MSDDKPISDSTNWKTFWSIAAGVFVANLLYDFGKAIIVRIMQ
jgi:hypothetical protein